MSQLGWWQQPNINGTIKDGNQTTTLTTNTSSTVSLSCEAAILGRDIPGWIALYLKDYRIDRSYTKYTVWCTVLDRYGPAGDIRVEMSYLTDPYSSLLHVYIIQYLKNEYQTWATSANQRRHIGHLNLDERPDWNCTCRKSITIHPQMGSKTPNILSPTTV